MIRRFTTIALLAASTLSAATFFPLQPGNTWTYRVAGTKMELTIQVGTQTLIGDKAYYSVTGYADRPILLRQEGDSLVTPDQSTGQELIVTSFEAFEGGWWVAYEHICDTVGQTKIKRASYDGPAGPIPNVLDVQYRTLGCADAGLLSEQYAENIGLLRRTVQSIAGPRTYDLVSARVGSLVIDANPAGRFTTAANVGADAIDVSLALDIPLATPLTLNFFSGQEYDIAVRNEDGLVVFLWSSVATFIQATHTRTVTGHWNATATIPKPAPGKYTIEAWLTTAGGSPRFAATVPLVLKPE